MILANYRLNIFFLEKSVDLFSADNLAGYVSTMIFALVNLLITYVILKYILFKPIKKILDKRSKEVDDLLSKNRINLSESEVLKKEYENKLKLADSEIQNKYSVLNSELENLRTEELCRIDNEIKHKKLIAEKEMAMDEAKHMAENEARSLSLSMKLLEVLYPKLSDKDSLSSIIDEARQEIKK